MSEGALVDIALGALVLLNGVFATLGAILVARFNAMRRDVAAVKHEVKNDHSKNMREEQDERHDENASKLDQLLDLVGWLANGWLENREDITTVLEHTGQGNTRRTRRLARARPPFNRTDIPGKEPPP